MKKVKVVLASFAVLAIVGTALAFKVKDSAFGVTVYCSTTQGATNCPAKIHQTYELQSNTGLFCTTSPTQACNDEAILKPKN